MTRIDDILLPKVKTLLINFGSDATFHVITGGVPYDPVTGIAAPVTSAVAAKITPPAPYDLGLVDGDIIQVGDMLTMVAASGLTFTPAREQRVTFDGRDWRIQRVFPVFSGVSICAYELQLRQ